MAIVSVGVDLAKNVFAVHGVDDSGKRSKIDAADAAAICEAVTRPTMRFVPVKSLAQQGQLLVHRARQGFVEQRTATLNRFRGLLSELGLVLPLKAAVVRREALARLEDLPGWANTVIGDLLGEVSRLDERIGPVRPAHPLYGSPKRRGAAPDSAAKRERDHRNRAL